MIKSLVKKILPNSVISRYHYFLAFAGALFYGFPSKKIKVIGVTGTNGKSTVVYLLAQMLKNAGYKVALSSSIEFWMGDKIWPNTFKMTMPGKAFLQKFLKQALISGCDYVIVEVTSEGILQNRHAFIDFDSVVLTNISPEHIERHGGYENYKRTKGKLFEALGSSTKNNKNIIINIADKEANYFLSLVGDDPTKRPSGVVFRRSDQVATTGIFSGIQEVVSANERVNKEGILFNINGVEFESKLQGVFNIENLLAVISVGIGQHMQLDDMSKFLKECGVVPGRLEKISNSRNIDIYVDYAHTPAALEAVYQTLSRNSELVCVLGAAGGGRDKWKRPELGRIAAQYCKKIILTNEDPYDEDPKNIIEAIEEGIKEKKESDIDFEIIIDRKKAIIKAIEFTKPGQALIVTGKGSENLMMLAHGEKMSWDDREIIKEIIA